MHNKEFMTFGSSKPCKNGVPHPVANAQGRRKNVRFDGYVKKGKRSPKANQPPLTPRSHRFISQPRGGIIGNQHLCSELRPTSTTTTSIVTTISIMAQYRRPPGTTVFHLWADRQMATQGVYHSALESHIVEAMRSAKNSASRQLSLFPMKTSVTHLFKCTLWLSTKICPSLVDVAIKNSFLSDGLMCARVSFIGVFASACEA